MSLFHILKHRPGRVLFVCIGNTFRSRMAEGFANERGSGLMEARSAGLIPGNRPSRTVQRLMLERGVALPWVFPRRVTGREMDRYDLVVNLTDSPLPATCTRVLHLPVPDPVYRDEEEQRDIRDRIEHLVDMLLLQFQQAKEEWKWDEAPETPPKPLAARLRGFMPGWASSVRSQGASLPV